MTQKTQVITRDQVVALALSRPLEKLASWYEYGLFIQRTPAFLAMAKSEEVREADLQAELAAWDTASPGPRR